MTDKEQKSLTEKQQIFLENYLQCWNASKAAQKAGYAHPGPEGARLLKHANIQREIQERLAEYAMSANEVLARLGQIARASVADFIVVDQTGTPARFDMSGNKPLHAVKKVTINKSSISIEMHDVMKALELLGKHHMLFVDIDFSKINIEILQMIVSGKINADDLRKAQEASTPGIACEDNE